jgi:valyl-tRNA synthetase
MNEELKKPYDPNSSEDTIYRQWEESGYFNPDNSPIADKSRIFSMVMPPTNANGNLHAGHGLVMTIEDIVTRYKRMQGFQALWRPGLDHAGFETQVVYEKKLEKEGRSRFDIPRDDLYKEILNFTLENSKNIKSQVRKMGASCDWSREKFTLDADIIETVYSTFKKLSDDSLLYRGTRIVNWCPKHQTSFSDLEITDVEKVDPLYYLKYGPFTIATARPETKFGDKYVVMHPEDTRYSTYKHGDKIDLEWINGPITATVIKDEAIDMEFGTGVMTITPWHDNTDFEIAERHGLEKEQIIDERGKLKDIAGEFAGMKIAEARQKIIEKLQSKGLVEKIDENYKHTVKTCYKCGTVIEPQIKSQWFVKMKPLAEKAIEKIESDEIVFLPDHYKKISLHWLQNINDWNISRQIVWGIPIPAKICDKCNEGFVDLKNEISSCTKCGGSVRQDSDTFDTWFSSGQWPFAANGFGTPGSDFDKFYPTDTLETAGDIIFFWVSRMIMLGLYVTDTLPFKRVYLHGLVLDGKGQKMSKSKGNVINPIELCEKFGTDAFRMALIVANTPGTSLALSEDKIKAYKHFANKIWNASRFVLENTQGFDQSEVTLDEYHKGLLSRLDDFVKEITEDMENYRFYMASEKAYHYFWHEFADVIIEESKARIKEGGAAKQMAQYTLRKILETSLIVLHPFMPFLTEKLWGMLPNRKNLLIVERWPYKQ